MVRCSARVRARLVAEGRIYIGWDACRVQDAPGVTRCYRCQSYGHTSQKCQGRPICGHCGQDGHERKDCPNRAGPAVCCNCKRFGKEASHDVASTSCPYYVRQLELVAQITDYGC